MFGRCYERRHHRYCGRLPQAVLALSELNVKDRGIIAYLHSEDTGQMQKLMSIGVLPGLPIVLLQRSPSYVFAMGYSQFAIDKQLAGAIYVRIAN
ncbi:MAG: hypothetical protein COW11_04555 [Candidatus Omnitrophica bacterium CG12_big_fil_rev_8_21_14_0_65_43_15]|uniref:Ferrous iron transporter FeoA-like domain-containing protein n=1 Tax=Candidatus Taenaricola geysiri TaxID=1974752 RepID=A0A2J0LJI9_9BACT|nr:MAG: hypothetical protein AUJ89_01275 [Candidatus Omnitrophica bacterium CG1_02_43_210]PIR65659.1 MAG: hypothetical protein COU52_03025 [Candidatus Omnitrophica bacterium CG10_big_fil_rev_8_21_14_0_10_43_8]PIV12162.1 MAG: hypothetical protein COS48_02290 [Candidatus Omnitrophica bacterium CG03_land_8_20_14_0_80_43_22]PIW66210.1 MAG: hypothetical protein COW11_04555 [Candidatus Omnitrophica bacterium CG12_big_fil_rev_8_21_14_0_65_43_15]PIW80592.1 MAG: hypothetical protein COZ98_01620 [Candida